MRRNNDELLANWGNLVNRTLVSAHRNFGAVPEPGELTDADTRAPRRGRRAASTRSARLIEQARFRAAIAEAMRVELAREPVRRRAGAVGARQDRPRARGDRALRRAARRSTRSRRSSRRSCRSRSQVVHELLGYDGWIAGPLEFRTVAEEDGSHARGADRRLRELGRRLGAERAPARSGAARAAAALPQADRPRSSRTSSHASIA